MLSRPMHYGDFIAAVHSTALTDSVIPDRMQVLGWLGSLVLLYRPARLPLNLLFYADMLNGVHQLFFFFQSTMILSGAVQPVCYLH